jgi:hypothetical protein
MIKFEALFLPEFWIYGKKSTWNSPVAIQLLLFFGVTCLEKTISAMGAIKLKCHNCLQLESGL